MTNAIASQELDYTLLDKLIDRTKSQVFMGSNASFLAPLMCSMGFSWVLDIPTACTNGISLMWNPKWFLELPEATRKTVLVHELWHPAFLHNIRRGNRNAKVWNWACDIMINNMLFHQGYTFDGTNPWMDDGINRWKDPGARSIGDYGDMPAEEIYDLLIVQTCWDLPGPIWGHGGVENEDEEPEEDDLDDDANPGGDIIEPQGDASQVDAQVAQILGKVVQASNAAKLAGMGAPAEVEAMLKRLLAPKIHWEILLQNWMSELDIYDYSWSRPNQRHQDIYLPSLVEEEGRLEHLIWYNDVSGSVSQSEIIRMNSETKHIWDHFRPKKMTIVLFDDRIQREIVFNEDDSYDEIVIQGHGGTDLGPVRQHIIDNKPTAAIIFSDMGCSPMKMLPPGNQTPILFIGVNADVNHKIKQGKIIYIRE